VTRRKLFLALLAPLVAKFTRKPAEGISHAWKEGGHTFYGIDFGKDESTAIFYAVLANKATLDYRRFACAVGTGYLHNNSVLSFTEEIAGPMARRCLVIDRLSPLIQGAENPVRHETA